MNSKYIKKMQPSNKKNEFKDSKEVEFKLQSNVVDITSFKIFYKAKADPSRLYSDGSYLKRFMPRISASIIQELIIEINGKTKQHIRDYNHIHNIIQDGLNDNDIVDNDRYDTLNYTTLGANNKYITQSDFVNNNTIQVSSAPLYYNYFIVNLLGFITEGQQFIDCKNNKIKIRIILAPSYICYEGLKVYLTPTTTTTYTDLRYTLKDVYLTIDCYDLNVPIKKDITFKDYKTFYGSVSENNKNIDMLIHHTGNINFILATFIDKDANTHTGLQLQYCNTDVSVFDAPIQEDYADLTPVKYGYLTPYNATVENIKSKCSENLLNNSLYFKRNGLTVKSCKLIHNGVDLTPDLNIHQLFLNAKDFFNGANNRVKTIPSFQNEFFVFPYNFFVKDETFKSEIVWNVETDTTKVNNGGIPIIFLCYDKTVNLN